jgi:glutamine amidotransferase PdxT
VEKLKSLAGVTVVEVRTSAQLESVDGLLIPGGESTAIALIAEASGLLEPLRSFIRHPRKVRRVRSCVCVCGRARARAPWLTAMRALCRRCGVRARG